MKHAFIIGGGGHIGRATTHKLIENGWRVTVAGRSMPKAPIVNSSINYVQLDRKNSKALKECLGETVDFLMDCLSFDETDAQQLADLSGQVGQICAISSISVYADKQGLTLDEAYENGFPNLPVPIKSDHPTVEAGLATYSTKKIAMEKKLLATAVCPVSILRPGAIYGPYSKHAREWFFVKRLLDGRKRIPLAYDGQSRFHPTSVENIAAAVLANTKGLLPAITNVVDPTAPTIREIASAIMSELGIEAEIIGLSGHIFPPKNGRSPWAIPKPFICEHSKHYKAIGTYQDLVGTTVTQLRDDIDLINWKEALPQLAWYPIDLFDYGAEDKILSELR